MISAKRLIGYLTLAAGLTLCIGSSAFADPGGATGQVGVVKKGPCDSLTPSLPAPDCSFDDCAGLFGSCDNGSWQTITYTGLLCQGAEGDCVEFDAQKDKFAKVKCSCADDDVTCEFDEYGYRSKVTKKDCGDVASTGVGQI